MKVFKIKNKGFTLIELLVSIVIMISILSLAIVSYTNISDIRKEEAKKQVQQQAIVAAKEFFNANEYQFEALINDSAESINITLEELVNNGYLTSLTNPKTGKKLDKCDIIKVTKKSGKYVFNYDDKPNCNKSPTFVYKTVETDPKLTLDVKKECSNGDVNRDWCNDRVIFNLTLRKDGVVADIDNAYYCTDEKGQNCSEISNNNIHEVTNETPLNGKTLYFYAKKDNKFSNLVSRTYYIDRTDPECKLNVSTEGTTEGNTINYYKYNPDVNNSSLTRNVTWYIPDPNNTSNSVSPKIKIEPTGSDKLSGFNQVEEFTKKSSSDKEKVQVNVDKRDNYISDDTDQYGIEFYAKVSDKAGNTNDCSNIYGFEKNVTLSLDTDKMKNTKSFNMDQYSKSMDNTCKKENVKDCYNYSSNGKLVFAKYYDNTNNNFKHPYACAYHDCWRNSIGCEINDCKKDENKCVIDDSDENANSCEYWKNNRYFGSACQRVSSFLNYFTVKSASIGNDVERVTFGSNGRNQDCFSEAVYRYDKNGDGDNTDADEATKYKKSDICKKAIGDYYNKSYFGNGWDPNIIAEDGNLKENAYDVFKIKTINKGDLFFNSVSNFTNYKKLPDLIKNEVSGVFINSIKFTGLSAYDNYEYPIIDKNNPDKYKYKYYNYGYISKKYGTDFTAEEYRYITPAGNKSDPVTLFTEYHAKCGYYDSDTTGKYQSACVNDFDDIRYWIKEYWIKAKKPLTYTPLVILNDGKEEVESYPEISGRYGDSNTNFSKGGGTSFTINRKTCKLKIGSNPEQNLTVN